MIKKILTLLTLVWAVTTSTLAAERINIVWAWAPGAASASMLREIATAANSKQSKFEFVVIDKQGAGGAVGANHVLQNPQNSILASTSAFFIRPYFNRETAYDLANFKPVKAVITDTPIALICKKYANLGELRKAKDISIADSGIGGTLYLISSVMRQAIPQARQIHYGSNYLQTISDVSGMHVDCAWHWVSDIEDFAATGNVNVIGITGKRNVKNFRTFASQDLSGFENLTVPTALFASSSMETDKLVELQDILNFATKNSNISKFVDREYGHRADHNAEETQRWFASQTSTWKRLAESVQNK